MLEDLARKLDNIKNPSETIKLFTELPPCPSRSKVIQEFIRRYPKISIEIIHN